MKKLVFIINPISGRNRKQKIPYLIEKHLDHSKFSYQLKYTQYAHHATELATKAVEEGAHIVVAVGGDGTVNEVSKALIDTHTALGIIPMGSGNGLARYLDIPLLPIFAIRNLNRERYKKIDTLIVDNQHCINVAGIGFDAHIAHLFANHGKRGLKSYLEIILKEFQRYKGEKLKLSTGENEIEKEIFLISIANSTQFGNAAHIAPKASASDGIIDISILKKFPITASIELGSRLFLKNINKSAYVENFKAKELLITILNNKQKIEGHIDGEPYIFNNPVKATIKPHSLIVVKGIKLGTDRRKYLCDFRKNIKLVNIKYQFQK